MFPDAGTSVGVNTDGKESTTASNRAVTGNVGKLASTRLL